MTHKLDEIDQQGLNWLLSALQSQDEARMPAVEMLARAAGFDHAVANLISLAAHGMLAASISMQALLLPEYGYEVIAPRYGKARVRLQHPGMRGRWSEDFFDLLPARAHATAVLTMLKK